MPGAYLYGWDPPVWRKVTVDLAGHLQVDTVTTALPAGAALDATLVTIDGRVDGLEGLLGAGLPATLDAGHLRVREQNWPATYPLSAAQIALLQAVTVGNFPADYPLPAAQVATLQQVTEQGTPSVHLYGFDTANWQYLQVESDVLHNLRVRLYAGANAILVKNAATGIAVTEYGLFTHIAVRGLRANAFQAIYSQYPQIDALPNTVESLVTTDFLMGYNGATWDRLRVDAAFRLLTNSMLYDGANAIDSDLIDANIFVSGERALLVRAQVCGYNLEPFHQRRTDSDALAAVSRELCQMTVSALYGFNGATWDRLRSDSDKHLIVNSQFGGNVYSKTMTMADDNPTRFEAAAKKLRDVVIIVKAHPMLLGETGVVVYPVGANETVGFTKVDISTLYFQNAGAGNNGVITILGVEE